MSSPTPRSRHTDYDEIEKRMVGLVKAHGKHSMMYPLPKEDQLNKRSLCRKSLKKWGATVCDVYNLTKGQALTKKPTKSMFLKVGEKCKKRLRIKDDIGADD